MPPRSALSGVIGWTSCCWVFVCVCSLSLTPVPSLSSSSKMAPGSAVAVMGIDFTLRYFYKVLLDLLPICNQDKGNKIR